MLLTELLANYKPAYPCSRLWADTFALLESNPFDKEVTQDLLTELARDGKFREPIILSVEDLSEDEDSRPYDAYVENGTHRIYAYYLAGHENVFAQEGWQVDNAEEMYGEDWSLYPETVTVFKPTASITEEQHEDIIDCLRSFKISDDYWLTSDLAVTVHDLFTVTWSGMELDEEKWDVITEAAGSRLAALLPDHKFIIKTVTFFSQAEYALFYQETQSW